MDWRIVFVPLFDRPKYINTERQQKPVSGITAGAQCYAGFIEYYDWHGPPLSVPFDDMFEDNGQAQSGIVEMRLLWNHEGTDYKYQGIRFSMDENGELAGVVVEPN